MGNKKKNEGSIFRRKRKRKRKRKEIEQKTKGKWATRKNFRNNLNCIKVTKMHAFFNVSGTFILVSY